jgi:hypothetical protein
MQAPITKVLFTNQATAAVSKPQLVEDMRNIVIYFTSAATTTATVKVKASMVDGVDFTTASSATNPWFWVATTPLDTGSSPVAGDTGYSVSSAYLNKAVEVETNLIRWVAAEITAISAGSVSAVFTARDNS